MIAALTPAAVAGGEAEQMRGQSEIVASSGPAIALTTNQNGNSVSIVELGPSGKPIKVAATIDVNGKPAGIAISPDRSTAYVTAPESKEFAVIDVQRQAVIKRVKSGQGPLGIAVNPRSGDVLVADWYEHELRVYDPDTFAVKAEVQTGNSPSGVAVTGDGKLIVTADRDSNQISLIDAATFKVVASVPVGTRPFGVTIDGSGTRAYTANVKSNDVSVIDIAAKKTVATYKVGRRPYAVALASGKAFITDQYDGTVSVIDLSSGKTLKAISVGEHPEGIAATSDGKSVLVACWMDNTLEHIDTETLKVTAKIDVGDGPRAFGDFLIEPINKHKTAGPQQSRQR